MDDCKCYVCGITFDVDQVVYISDLGYICYKDATTHYTKQCASQAATIAQLREAIAKALQELRSTQKNWDKDCLFNCNDILAAALRGGKG